MALSRFDLARVTSSISRQACARPKKNPPMAGINIMSD
jgi:hypothetical protein